MQPRSPPISNKVLFFSLPVSVCSKYCETIAVKQTQKNIFREKAHLHCKAIDIMEHTSVHITICNITNYVNII